MSDNSLLQEFILETGEYLEVIERNLLRLEQRPDDAETLKEIFRSVHTIKGSSEYLGMECIAELSHRLESLLDLMRRGERSVDSRAIDLLISCNDRFGDLVNELQEHQVEQSPIDDLVSLLKASIEQSGCEAEAEEPSVQDDIYDDDEYDEELFGIFIEQLKEGLSGLAQDVRQLGDGREAVPVLERSADRLTTLRSSSGYMGFDELKSTYEQWSQAVDRAIMVLKSGEDFDLEAFSQGTMAAGIEKVQGLFPKVSFDSIEVFQKQSTAASAGGTEMESESAPGPGLASELDVEKEPETVVEREPEASVEDEEPAVDQGLLADFIAETGEHLEETERNLLKLEQQPDDVDTLNEIFRSVHTIKGSSEYLGMERIAELSHRLESLLDLMRRGERSVDSRAIDLLITCNDRFGDLVGEVDRDKKEQLSIEDLLSQLDECLSVEEAAGESPIFIEKLVIEDESGAVYGEEYDQELFSIFLDQLNAGLETLTGLSGRLGQGEPVNEVLDRCLEQLDALWSSANYMEYDELREIYESWREQLSEASANHAAGEHFDVDTFNRDMMTANIEKTKKFFSNLTSIVHRPEGDTETEPQAFIDIADLAASSDIDLAQEFKTMTLDELREPDDIITLDALPLDDDDRLLDKLADAFDSRLGYSDDDTKQTFNEHIENNLFSASVENKELNESHAINASEKPDADHDIVDVEDVESLLFSETQDAPSAEEAKLPERVIAPPPEQSQPLSADGRESEDRRKPYGIGRRQSDKFRDRMLKQSIRVDAGKIDTLMNQVGELVVSRSGFTQLFADMRELQLALKHSRKLEGKEMQIINDITNRINEATIALGRVTSDIQENVMKVRMLPIAQLFSRYPRLVHDLVRNTEKKVNLEIYGEETELDKKVIEQLADPLVHIIRNAVDHGIEDIAERRQKGKDETGTIRLEAYHESNYVVIEISDDGRGIDTDQVKQRAVEMELITSEEAETINEQEILPLIMHPGFSTSREVTTTSGRGVGMDVVKDNVDKMNGTIEMINTVGTGAKFRIKIPLTLAIIPALLVRVGNEIFTIPLATVDETIRVSRDEVSTIEGLEVFYLRDTTIPLIRLKEAFNMGAGGLNSDDLFVVIVNAGAKQVGLVVDELRGRQEVVIKPLEDYLQEKSGFSGATILGDGGISLILDVYEMVQLSLERHNSRTTSAA